MGRRDWRNGPAIPRWSLMATIWAACAIGNQWECPQRGPMVTRWQSISSTIFDRISNWTEICTWQEDLASKSVSKLIDFRKNLRLHGWWEWRPHWDLQNANPFRMEPLWMRRQWASQSYSHPIVFPHIFLCSRNNESNRWGSDAANHDCRYPHNRADREVWHKSCILWGVKYAYQVNRYSIFKTIFLKVLGTFERFLARHINIRGW